MSRGGAPQSKRTASGGLRAYTVGLGKDRSASRSRLSIASVE